MKDHFTRAGKAEDIIKKREEVKEQESRGRRRKGN